MVRRSRRSLEGIDVTGGSHLELLELCKTYGHVEAVKDVTLGLRQGEFLTILGPSGSGKSTTLMMIAGFEEPSRGDIRLDGRSLLGIPPRSRNFGVVFQSYALFPHMTVIENVCFPLEMRGIGMRDRRTRALDVLQRLGLKGLEHRRPRELSGGEQQRVALARSLVFEPSALLLDEPFGALDRSLRQSLQLEVKEVQRRFGVAVLFVTHDQEEAMVMSDRIGVMHRGRIVQVGPPEEVYHSPATAFVAGFLGETNLFRVRQYLGATGEYMWMECDGGLRIAAKHRGVPATGAPKCRVSIRPERIRLLRDDLQGPTNVARGVVDARVFVGSYVRYRVAMDGCHLIVRSPDGRDGAAAAVGDPVVLGWSAEDTRVVPE